jgi:hypothetical protein
MNQKRITELLQLQDKEIAAPTPFCPSGHEVAALFEGKRDNPDYDHFERHLADCSYCQARVAVVARLHQNTDEEQIPEALFDAASQFGNQPRKSRLRRAPAWAAAAVVAITLFTVIGKNPYLTSGTVDQVPPRDGTSRQARVLRNIGRVDPGPTVLSPVDGERIVPDEMTIRWTRVPGSLYYDVRLVNAEGFMIWRDRVKETRSNLPSDIGLVSGERYFVRVDAYLAEGKSVGSPHVKFTVESDD